MEIEFWSADDRQRWSEIIFGINDDKITIPLWRLKIFEIKKANYHPLQFLLIVYITVPQNYYNDCHRHQSRTCLSQWFINSHFEQFFPLKISNISPLKSHVIYFFNFSYESLKKSEKKLLYYALYIFFYALKCTRRIICNVLLRPLSVTFDSNAIWRKHVKKLRWYIFKYIYS